MGVEVEFEKSNPEMLKQTQPTPTEESEVEQVTPEQVFRRSSRSIRAPDRFSPLLHYLFLTYEGEPKSFDVAGGGFDQVGACHG